MNTLIQFIKSRLLKNLSMLVILWMTTSAFAQFCPPACGGGGGTPTLKMLVANSDTLAVTNPNGGGIPVLANDTADGILITPLDLQPIGDLRALMLNDAGLNAYVALDTAGVLTVFGSPPAGSHTLTYELCQPLFSGNCVLGTITLTITAAPVVAMVAVSDTASIPPASTTVTVLSNDTVNGATATAATAVVTIVSDGGLVGLSVNGSGQLVVPARAAGSSHAPTYKICEVGNLTNCSATVTVSLTTLAGPVAVADTASAAVGVGLTVNILSNDVFNGVQATASNVTAQLIAPVTGFSINGASQLVAAPSVAAGTYPVAYKICDIAVPASCSASVNATVTITAAPVINGASLVARDDGITMPVAGGSLNVLTNDLYNAAALNASMVTITLMSNGGIAGAVINNQGVLYIPTGLLPSSYSLAYKVCLISSPTTCATARVSIIISASVTTAVRKAPSVSGPTASTTNIVTAGQSPISFGTGGTTAPGSINDALVFSGARLSFGDRPGGLTYLDVRASQDIPSFNALLFYSGSGQLKARWEVIQPGDADPNEFDLAPEDSLTLAQRVQRHSYTLIDRATGYLAPTGSYQLLGPNPSRLPKSRLGSYRILLRLEATSNGISRAFYIPFITYRVLSDPIVVTAPLVDVEAKGSSESTNAVKSRFTANTSVTDYSKIGDTELGAFYVSGGGIKTNAYATTPPLVGFESINTTQPKAGQQLTGSEPLNLMWEAPKSATVAYWHLEIRDDASNDRLVVARVAQKAEYMVAPVLAKRLPRDAPLKWRVMGVSKEGYVTATSSWLFFTIKN